MPKITPFLWFDNNAEQAADFYLSLFPNARRLDDFRGSGDGAGPWEKGAVGVLRLEIEGQPLIFLNGGPGHPLTDAFSLMVNCESQAEIDGYWNKILANGGSEIACGWIRDSFGLCWQIVPTDMMKLIRHPKAMAAMMTMKKIDIMALEAAASED